MRSPKDRLVDAIEAWRRDRAVERVARWRGDPDALDAAAVAARHARLRGPRARELFEESVERGLLDGDERAAVVLALRDAHRSVAQAAGDARLRDALRAPVPYDSDFHAGTTLLARLLVHPAPRVRRGITRALERTFEDVAGALAERRARIEEASEAATWLPAATLDEAPDIEPEAILAATDEVWQEVLARLGHAAKTPTEDWSDLLHVLRAPRWDDLVPRPSRARRVARSVEELGLGDVLARGVRLEPPAERRFTAVVVVTPSRDLRVSPGVELGLASERDLAAALARAAIHLLAHPGLPAVLRRPTGESVARTVGALVAHLFADPTFAERAFSALSPRERRGARELALGLELFELRAAAAAVAAHAHRDRRDFVDRARDVFVRALGVDVSPRLAGIVAMDDEARHRLRAARLAPPLAVALREQFDEDFFRNPRVAEPLRHAASRGSALGAEAWAEELGVDPDALGARMTELLG
ncbi:MAG: hypothetical protein KC619_28750 [Myxococcales bacterium]|nr:hypothetical protein [Myxococcales bacterium]